MMNEAYETESSRYPSRSAGGAWLAPSRGLTLRKGAREVNVHDVRDGMVYCGIYEDGSESPIALYRITIERWIELAELEVLHVASAYVYLGDNSALIGARPRQGNGTDGS